MMPNSVNTTNSLVSSSSSEGEHKPMFLTILQQCPVIPPKEVKLSFTYELRETQYENETKSDSDQFTRGAIVAQHESVKPRKYFVEANFTMKISPVFHKVDQTAYSISSSSVRRIHAQDEISEANNCCPQDQDQPCDQEINKEDKLLQERLPTVPDKTLDQDDRKRSSQSDSIASIANSIEENNSDSQIHNSRKCTQVDEGKQTNIKKSTISGKTKRVQCNDCNKLFPDNYTLKLHKLTVHAGKKLHCCPQCDKKFGRKEHLTRHLLTHTGNSYTCPQCLRTFSQKGYLGIHIFKVHEGKKTQQCPMCEKRFGSKSNLDAHLRSTHLNEKPYACVPCQKEFSQKSCLNRHLASHCHKNRLNKTI